MKTNIRSLLSTVLIGLIYLFFSLGDAGANNNVNNDDQQSDSAYLAMLVDNEDLTVGTLVVSEHDNVLINGDFTDGLESWEPFIADFAGVSAVVAEVDGEAAITDIAGAGADGEVWHVQLSQILTSGQIDALEVGAEYTIQFDARSNVDGRQLRLFFGEDGGGFAPLIIADTVLTESMTTHEFSFDVTQTFGAMKLGFEMGLSDDDVYIDNVSLMMTEGDGEDEVDAPMAAAPTPTEDADDVISVFSDAYTSLEGTNFNPNWGQSTQVETIDIDGSATLKYSNFNYQGTEFASAIDASGMTTMHLDMWTADAASVNFFLISTGPEEKPYELPITTGEWVSYEIPISHFDNVDLADIIQFKFDGGDTTPTIYLDNLYFSGESDTPPISDNLVINGDFSDGLESWEPFIADFAGVSADVAEVDGEAAITNIDGAGGEVWHVQLNQILTSGQIDALEVGAEYTIQFDARSNVDGRQLRLFFGEDGGGFAPLIIADTVLTESMTTHEFSFDVTQTFGAMKLGFEMGLTNDDVFIDNVSLVQTGDIDDSNGDIPTGNLLTNGDFEDGDDGSWYGNALDIRTEDGNSFNFADVETAGNPWNVNLSQDVDLTSGQSYVLTFEASTGEGNTREMLVGIGESQDPFRANTETVSLTESTRTFRVDLVANDDGTGEDFGDATSRVLFDMGADVGIVVIDNVSLEVAVVADLPGEAPPEQPARNASDVISIFSDRYDDIEVDTFSADFDDSDIEDVMIEGTPAKKIDFNNFIAIDFQSNRQNASEMTHFHMNFWTDESDLVGKVFNSKFSQWGGGDGEVSALELNLNTGTDPELVSGTWVTVDVPIEHFTGSLTRDDLAQFLITSNVDVAFVANIYLYKDVGVSNELSESPLEFELNQNYPNPFNPTTSISYTLPESGDVTLEVFNAVGQKVAILVNSTQNAGYHTVSFDASNLASGVYLYRLSSGNQVQINKMLLLK